MRRVLDSRVEVFLFKKGIIGKNLVKRRTIGNKLKDVRDSNPLTANTRPAARCSYNLSGFMVGATGLEPVAFCV
jgi:hypothetical protein